MVANLEAKGYLRREAGVADKRAKLLYVTELDGQIKQAAEAAELRFYNWLIEDLNPEELGVFFKVLHEIYERSKHAGKHGFEDVSED